MTNPSVRFAGLTFRGLTLADVLPSDSGFKQVVTVNADFVVRAARSHRFARLICDNCSTFDGQITWYLGKLLAHPKGIPFEKISGSSLAYSLLEHAAQRGMRVFFLGATPSVNAAAVRIAVSKYGVSAAGFSPPFAPYPFPESLDAEVLQHIASFRPHILFAGLGSPKQEYWLNDHRTRLEEYGVRLAIGCGGTIDFLAGALPRANPLIQKLGLEGVYRFVVQPSWFRARRLLVSSLVVPIALWRSMLRTEREFS